jgi:hypothetical protein
MDRTPDTMAQALTALAEAIAELGRIVARVGSPGRSAARAAHAKVRDACTALAEHVNAVPGWMAGKEATERGLREQLGLATAALLDDASDQLDDDAARAPNVRGWRILAAGGWLVVALFVAREFTR